ncbi:MAG: hypothetical protein AB1497_09045 [Bacillota bacterium]
MIHTSVWAQELVLAAGLAIVVAIVFLRIRIRGPKALSPISPQSLYLDGKAEISLGEHSPFKVVFLHLSLKWLKQDATVHCCNFDRVLIRPKRAGPLLSYDTIIDGWPYCTGTAVETRYGRLSVIVDVPCMKDTQLDIVLSFPAEEPVPKEYVVIYEHQPKTGRWGTPTTWVRSETVICQ